jgi:Penicillin-Binding Protein C-terminus Family
LAGDPEIAFPPAGAYVDLGIGRGAGQPLAIRLGATPFRWLVDGAPIPVDPFARQADWRPDCVGFVDLAVIDATGRAARIKLFLEDFADSPLRRPLSATGPEAASTSGLRAENAPIADLACAA